MGERCQEPKWHLVPEWLVQTDVVNTQLDQEAIGFSDVDYSNGIWCPSGYFRLMCRHDGPHWRWLTASRVGRCRLAIGRASQGQIEMSLDRPLDWVVHLLAQLVVFLPMSRHCSHCDKIHQQETNAQRPNSGYSRSSCRSLTRKEATRSYSCDLFLRMRRLQGCTVLSRF